MGHPFRLAQLLARGLGRLVIKTCKAVACGAHGAPPSADPDLQPASIVVGSLHQADAGNSCEKGQKASRAGARCQETAQGTRFSPSTGQRRQGRGTTAGTKCARLSPPPDGACLPLSEQECPLVVGQELCRARKKARLVSMVYSKGQPLPAGTRSTPTCEHSWMMPSSDCRATDCGKERALRHSSHTANDRTAACMACLPPHPKTNTCFQTR